MLTNNELEYLRIARKRRGINQRELAKRLGVTQSALANIEAGRVQSPRRELMQGLLAVLKEWREEDEKDGLIMPRPTVREEAPVVYWADTTCPKCSTRVPSPKNKGVHYCLACAYAWPAVVCRACGRRNEFDAQYCAGCGERVHGSVTDDTGA